MTKKNNIKSGTYYVAAAKAELKILDSLSLGHSKSPSSTLPYFNAIHMGITKIDGFVEKGVFNLQIFCQRPVLVIGENNSNLDFLKQRLENGLGVKTNILIEKVNVFD